MGTFVRCGPAWSAHVKVPKSVRLNRQLVTALPPEKSGLHRTGPGERGTVGIVEKYGGTGRNGSAISEAFEAEGPPRNIDPAFGQNEYPLWT